MAGIPHNHNHAHDLNQIITQSEKIEDFEKTAKVFEKLGDARRMQIFWILCHCEECVTDLSAMIGMSSPAVSHHLKVLKECGLIRSERDGREVIYRVTDNELAKLLHVTTEEIMAVSCPDSEIVPESKHDSLNEVYHCHEHSGCNTHSHDAHSHDSLHINDECSCNHSNDTLAEEIHEYLNSHLDQHITIESLAKQFCVNPTTIKTVFRNTFGNSVAAHTREHRMERASELLLSTDYSLGEIAQMVGYQSQSKFTKAFRETYGILPKDYRSRH